jgi:hypothetical protein
MRPPQYWSGRGDTGVSTKAPVGEIKLVKAVFASQKGMEKIGLSTNATLAVDVVVWERDIVVRN